MATILQVHECIKVIKTIKTCKYVANHIHRHANKWPTIFAYTWDARNQIKTYTFMQRNPIIIQSHNLWLRNYSHMEINKDKRNLIQVIPNSLM